MSGNASLALPSPRVVRRTMHDMLPMHRFDCFVAQGKLAMPVLAIGGEKSFGTQMAAVMRFAASNVQGAVIPNPGHWIMEENPAAAVQVITAFLGAKE